MEGGEWRNGWRRTGGRRGNGSEKKEAAKELEKGDER